MILPLCLLVCTGVVWGDPPRRVVLVSLDGLRPDALAKAKTPTLDKLIKRGVSAARARTILPSFTLPSHTSMLTGLTPGRHGVFFWNSYDKRRGYIKSKTILDLAQAKGMETAMFAGKKKFWHLSRGAKTWRRVGNQLDAMPGLIRQYLLAKTPRLLFIHFSDPDSTGHDKGWMSDEQIAVIGRVDSALGKIITHVEASGMAPNVVWIITSDHGGHGKIHGTPLAVDMNIPWICFGPGIRQGYRLMREIRTYDTAPTVLQLLGIRVPKQMQGRPVSEVFASAGPKRGGAETNKSERKGESRD